MVDPSRSLPDLAVTGSTGQVGGRVAASLSARGIPQRLIVRDPSRAPALAGAVAVGASSFGDAEAMRRALDGVRTLFLVSGRETEDRLAQHLNAVDAAVAAGVQRVVYLSFLNAAPDATFKLARQHHATEEHIRASGARYTFLRNSLYADFVPFFTGADGVIRGPAGAGRVSWVSRDDIADVAVAAILADDRAIPELQRALDVTGPEALSLGETAKVLGRVTGRSISYREETIEEAWESRRPSGAPEWEIEGWVTSYVAIANGELETVGDAVARIAGHPPQGLGPFLSAHPALWTDLVEPSGDL